MDWPPPFKVCYHCGSAAIRRLRETAFECDACSRHLFINPVSAVAGILLDPSDRILLIQRAKEPAKGKLSLPGGFLDPGETAEEGLAREVREETGLEIGEVRYVGGFPNQYEYDGTVYLVLDLFFEGRVKSFDDAAALDEVDDIMKVPVSEIDFESLAFPSVKRALRGFCENHQSIRSGV